MKLNRLFLFFLLFLFGCSSDKEQPEVINPIELFPPSGTLGYGTPEDSLAITNGNGGYKVFYPKKIYKLEPIDPSDPHMVDWYEHDFPKEKIRVSIVDTIIYFEGDFSREDPMYCAYFLITDSKDEKKITHIGSDYLGSGPRFDRETELQLLNNPDYWLE